MVLQYSDHVHRVYTCKLCGLESDGSGMRRTVPKGEVQRVVDAVYRELSRGKVRIELQPFIRTVEKVCLKQLNGHIPVIKQTELNSWGYEVIGETIIKVK